ncbi:hypothetical protein [Kocuria rhizophila]|uniref:hypothetical protein n=1 Tax=Kocuria rhizophila TaxID=72000 RepID=UPI001642F987|nr:hypothetical protein [Kocuria rhizophila]MCT1958463.1 hypothetical protein [Kocuria rhizophila]MCT2074434.1 hypothetical protein [Kocuria rhizophila]
MSRSSRKTLGPVLRAELWRAVRHVGARRAFRLLLLFPPVRWANRALRALRLVRGH